MLDRVVSLIQSKQPQRVTLHPVDVDAVQRSLEQGAVSMAVYHVEDQQQAPRKPMPPGAVMMLLGVPVFASRHVAQGSVDCD
jgi:hypothetical protein